MKLYNSLKRMVPACMTGLLAAALLAGCQQELPAPGNDAEEFAGTLKSAQITNLMVLTKSETLPAGFEEQLAAFGEIVSTTPEIGMVVINPKNGKAQAQIAKLKEVQAVVPDIETRWIDPVANFVATPDHIGSDEGLWANQWNMRAISAPAAWDAGYTGEGARVFILDSGIDADNPEFWDNLNIELSTSFVPEETFNVRPGYFFNHGTHVAGIIAAADNQWGVIGVAPNAEIVAVKVLSEYTGSGSFSNITKGIIYAALNGADVINMSLGALLNRNGNYMDDDGIWQQGPANLYQAVITAQQRAVNFAVKMGAVVVASAGNDYFNADGSGSLYKIPADLQGVIAVSATAPQCWASDPAPNFDLPASYTNYGKSLVAMAAPGGDATCEAGYPYDMVYSCATGGPTSYAFAWSGGTSMAAPHVAGVAALIIGKAGGQMNPVAVQQQLFKTADKIEGNGVSAYYGNGRVNAYRAVTE